MNLSITTMVPFGIFLCLSYLSMTADAWTTRTTTTTSSTYHPSQSLTPTFSRQQVLQTLGTGALATILAPAFPALADESLPGGITYEVVKSGNGPKPDVGELIAIRFAAFAGSNKIDDIFDTPEPYYTRLGSGGLLKGVETTLPYMRLGDRWKITIPSELAFGKKGRPASAGKPRIPADSTITFDVEIVGLPGKEPELIELIGGDDE